MMGPWGPSTMVKLRSDFTRRFAKVYGEDSPYILDYLYHAAVQHPTGEHVFQGMYSMAVFAKNPLQDRLRHDLPDDVKHMPVSFIFGKSTWMAPHVAVKEAEVL